MNANIFHLAIKANTEALKLGQPGDPAHDEYFIKTFSSLIIQECLDICEQGAATQTTSQGAAILIRQKFGI
jgi:hypothetical protein